MRLTILLNSFTIPINMNIISFKNKRRKKSSQSIVNFFVKTQRDSLNSEGSNDFYFIYCLFNQFICNWFAKIVVINLNNNSKCIKNLLIEGRQYFQQVGHFHAFFFSVLRNLGGLNSYFKLYLFLEFLFLVINMSGLGNLSKLTHDFKGLKKVVEISSTDFSCAVAV